MNLDFNEICRLCLRFCEKYVDLNQANGVKNLSKELAEKIKFCYLVQMDLSEGLPTKVCYECIQVISFFYIAKKNVVISEQLLRDVLYVRKKLQDEAKIHKEENMTRSSLIKLKPEKQKTSQLQLATNSKPQNMSNVKINFNNNPECNSVSNIECNINSSLSNNPPVVGTTTNKQHNDLGVRKKKKKKFKYLKNHSYQNNKLQKPLNVPGNTSEISLKYKVSKKLRNLPKRNSKTCTDNITAKEAPETDTSLDEYVVKNIGTVIDTSNILSPEIKRLRKSVLGK